MLIALKSNKLIYIIEELSDNILKESFAWNLNWKTWGVQILTEVVDGSIGCKELCICGFLSDSFFVSDWSVYS